MTYTLRPTWNTTRTKISMQMYPSWGNEYVSKWTIAATKKSKMFSGCHKVLDFIYLPKPQKTHLQVVVEFFSSYRSKSKVAYIYITKVWHTEGSIPDIIFKEPGFFQYKISTECWQNFKPNVTKYEGVYIAKWYFKLTW